MLVSSSPPHPKIYAHTQSLQTKIIILQEKILTVTFPYLYKDLVLYKKHGAMSISF